MRDLSKLASKAGNRGRRTAAAFSLTEVMVAMGLLVMVIGGVLLTHVFGLRMFELAEAKVDSTGDARKAISRMIGEIRGAKMVLVGNGSLTNFTEMALNTPQQGSACQIYPTIGTNAWIRYFRDTASNQLRRTTNGATSAAIIANNITNTMIFTAEDYAGNILTNDYNNRVIGVAMQFYQIQYPVYRIGPGNYYDFYQLRTKVTRRTLE